MILPNRPEVQNLQSDIEPIQSRERSVAKESGNFRIRSPRSGCGDSTNPQDWRRSALISLPNFIWKRTVAGAVAGYPHNDGRRFANGRLGEICLESLMHSTGWCNRKAKDETNSHPFDVREYGAAARDILVTAQVN